jgi:hypothetical protein
MVKGLIIAACLALVSSASLADDPASFVFPCPANAETSMCVSGEWCIETGEDEDDPAYSVTCFATKEDAEADSESFAAREGESE